MRILQVVAVLGAFWALSACISMMNGKKVTEAPAQPQSGTLMRGSKSIDLLLTPAAPGTSQHQQQNAGPLMMGSKSAPPVKP